MHHTEIHAGSGVRILRSSDRELPPAESAVECLTCRDPIRFDRDRIFGIGIQSCRCGTVQTPRIPAAQYVAPPLPKLDLAAFRDEPKSKPEHRATVPCTVCGVLVTGHKARPPKYCAPCRLAKMRDSAAKMRQARAPKTGRPRYRMAHCADCQQLYKRRMNLPTKGLCTTCNKRAYMAGYREETRKRTEAA